MSEQSKRSQALSEFEKACRARGVPLTLQRRLILEAVLGRKDHPTADQIYEAVQNRTGGISRTTVYRVLETLVQMGFIRMVCNPGAAARFDPYVDQHHHLVCLHCGRMTDLDDPRLDNLPMPKAGAVGFQITDYTVHFRGICRECQRKIGATKPAKPTKRSTTRKP